MSVMDREIDLMPVAVLDFETTGLSPKTGARVIEIGVARVEPGMEPRVVMDTLVDPEGPVQATDIHGITDADVVGAPTFKQVAGALFEALDGAVVLAYNAAFDMAFLKAELARASRLAEPDIPPHLCLMWLRPLLGLGKRASLFATCEDFGLPAATHAAADDATVASYLWLKYRAHARENGVRTFGDLSRRGTHKYLKTLTAQPYARTFGLAALCGPAQGSFKCRPGRKPVTKAFHQTSLIPSVASAISVEQSRVLLDQHFGEPAVAARRRAYWHALVAALGDRELSADEVSRLHSERQRLALGEHDVRALHSRYVGQRLLQMVEDQAIDPHESGELRGLFMGMRELGWAPGD